MTITSPWILRNGPRPRSLRMLACDQATELEGIDVPPYGEVCIVWDELAPPASTGALSPGVIREASRRMKDAMRGVPNPVPLPSRAELWADFQAAFADNCTPTEWLAAVKLLVLE